MTACLLPTSEVDRRLGAPSGQISANSDEPHFQTLDATMVFGDVAGFTKMSERLGAVTRQGRS